MTIAVIAILYSSFLTIGAADQDLEKQLAGQYHSKILYLRHSLTSDSQEYTAERNPVKSGHEGPWFLYGRIVVGKVVLDKDKLRIEGNRAVFKSDGQPCGNACMPSVIAEPVTVKIRLNGPLSSVSDAEMVLGHVFATTRDEVVRSAPPYWQDYLAKLFAHEPAISDQHLDEVGEKVFKLGEGNVTPPKPLSAPEPDFSEIARQQGFQGTVDLNAVIDKTGQISRVSIGKPLGLGLDEQAANKIRTWRFKPGTRNGEPVAVALWIEVDFHLGR